jgi:hypothetical protein
MKYSLLNLEDMSDFSHVIYITHHLVLQAVIMYSESL